MPHAEKSHKRKGESKRSRIPLSHRLHDVLDIPLDGISEVSRVEVLGRREVIIDGCDCVLIYTAECIVVRVREGYIRLKGKRLEMQSLQNDRVTVRGEIETVLLCEVLKAEDPV